VISPKRVPDAAATTDVGCALKERRCIPCEGGVPKLSRAEAEALRAQTPAWEINADATRIHRSWTVRHFLAAMRFFEKVADLAEREAHHPDLHLERYRSIRIEIWTHAIGGLSENDFILAAKIDELPIELKA
jgi:4a-hydroxytetrahydrobiopterin dehydratase